MSRQKRAIQIAAATALVATSYVATAATCVTDSKAAPDGRLIVMFGRDGKLTQMGPSGGFFTYEYKRLSESGQYEVYEAGNVGVALHKTHPVVHMIFTSGDKAGQYTYICDSLITVQR